jgi:hypothetical protein
MSYSASGPASVCKLPPPGEALSIDLGTSKYGWHTRPSVGANVIFLDIVAFIVSILLPVLFTLIRLVVGVNWRRLHRVFSFCFGVIAVGSCGLTNS